MTKILEVKNLTVSFEPEDYLVVHDMDFHLNKGEILGICGESGSGKSMTALSLLQLQPKEAKVEGEISFKGENLLGLSQRNWRKIRGQDIAIVFQNAQTALNPTMRVGKQIAEGLIIHHTGLTRQERRDKVYRLLANLGFNKPEEIARSYPHELSGGMRQRIGLSIALINSPDLLILDEATTALDPSLQKQFLDLVRQIKAEIGQSLIFISHDIRLVQDFCDRVLIFYAGEKVEEGPVSDVFKHPSHIYTKLLLEAMPRDTEPGESLVEIPLRVPSSEEITELLGRENPPCLFANRCPFALDKCWVEKPDWRDLGRGHLSACHLAEGLYASSWSRELRSKQGQELKSMQAQEETESLDDRQMQDANDSESATQTAEASDQSLVEDNKTSQKSNLEDFPTPYLLVEAVSHSFDRRGPVKKEDLVLDDLNFRIYPRQFTGLVGESGSGKSTLARLVSGQLSPLKGKIYLDGKEISGLSKRARRKANLGIQMIFQDPFSSLHPEQCIARQIEEPLIIEGKLNPHERRKKVLSMMEEVGLNLDLANRMPYDLSGGQQQRVAIACALITEPKLLIADEALSALDLSVQAQIINLLQTLRQKQDFACLFISHDMDVVRYLCDRVAVLFQGKIIEENKTERVFANPQQPYTKKLLESTR